MMVLGSVALLAARNDAWKQAKLSGSNLLLALDRDIGRTIAIADLSLTGLIEALAEPGIDSVSPGIRHHALFDRSASAEGVGSLVVLDAQGDLVEDSTSILPHSLNLGDRDYFRVHAADANAGLYLSRAFKSRLAGGDFRFAITRRIPSATGEFAGVVTAGMRLQYFRDLFEKLDLGRYGAITLTRTDGHIIVRYPFREQDVDFSYNLDRAASRRILTERSGQYVARAALDGVERLMTFRRIGDLPLVLTVSYSTDEIYAPWRRKAAVILPVMIILCTATVTLSLLFRREMKRRERSERALAAAAQQLSVLASTDGLTGLNNRRTFDLEFDRAFRRAVRKGTPVAVLMLDVDYFKRFNDTYGHPAGDDVLRAIAECMEMHVRRPDDLKARYGGEEFVAILPETGVEAAQTVADHIRVAVQERRITHTGSPIGCVTVSVGVAAVTPMVGYVASELLNLADQALYRAKREGKNCVRSVAEAGYDPALPFDRLVALGEAAGKGPGLRHG